MAVRSKDASAKTTRRVVKAPAAPAVQAPPVRLPPTKSRLGRGLATLIRVDAAVAEETGAVDAAAGDVVGVAVKGVEIAGAARQNAIAGPGSQVRALVAQHGETPARPVAVAVAAAPAAVQIDVSHRVAGGPVLTAVPLKLVAANPHQPRKAFDEVALNELAESIRHHGLIQPITVRKTTGGYELIAGERRTRAARLLGLTEVLAIVVTADTHAQAEQALVENIQRQDLNPIDRAVGYATLMEELGLTQEQLAARMGEQRSTVANHLRLLDLCGPAKEYLRSGKLSLGHAKVIAGVADVLEQARLAELAVRQGLSVRNLERVMKLPAPGAARVAHRPIAAGEAHYAELEQSFTRQIGTRVEIRPSVAGKGRGRIVLHYGSLEEFDNLAERLAVELPES